MSSKEPIDVRLRNIIHKITTSGKDEPDSTLVSELCAFCCGDQYAVRIFFSILLMQLQKNHAEIRLGVVRLLDFMTDRKKFATALQSCPGRVFAYSDVQVAIRNVKELAMRHLQIITGLVLRTDEAESRPLPPPQKAVEQMRVELLTLFLEWEREMKPPAGPRVTTPCPKTTCTSHACGQLKTFLQFLRTGNPGHENRFSDLHRAVCDLRRLEEERAYRLRRARRIRRLKLERVQREVDGCLVEIAISGERMEENLYSLSSLLELLVPDPTALDSDTSMHEEGDGTGADVLPSYADTLRLHGHLPGTSSGLASASSAVEFTLPIAQKSVVRITRTEDTQILEVSARERAALALDKHRPLLLFWLQRLQHKDLEVLDEPRRQRVAHQLNILLHWRDRMERLIHLFYDRLLFVDEDDQPAVSEAPSSPDCSDDQQLPHKSDPDASDSSDFSDFEDVPVPGSGCGDVENSELSVRSISEQDGGRLTAECAGNSADRRSPRLGERSAHRPRRSRPSSPSTRQSASIELPAKGTVVWPSTESTHRFWQPIDIEKYTVPADYMGSATSMSLDAEASMCDTEVGSSGMISKLTKKLTEPAEAKRVTEADRETDKHAEGDRPAMACWAPLPSGRRCQRRNPSGVCRIHGRVVTRDRNTGRPTNPEDRERLRQEAATVRLTKEAERLAEHKRQARRRYPGLTELARRKATFKSRLLSTRRMH